MFYELKITRKGSKPLVWRRAIIPADITFAQFAYILETIVEYEISDRYEFDFFRKYRISEMPENSVFRDKHYYTYMNAPDIFVRDILSGEKNFTFRILNSDLPEYAVTREHFIQSVKSPDGGYVYPHIIKQISYKEDNFPTDPNEINRILEERFRITEKYPDYAGIYQAEQASLKEGFLYVSAIGESKHDKTEYSVKLSAYNTADSLRDILKKNDDLPHAKVYDMIKHYSSDEIINMAADDGFLIDSEKHKDIALEYCRYILEPEVMKKRLLALNHEEFELFSEACDKVVFALDENQRKRYQNIYDLSYLCTFTNKMAMIAEDAAKVFRILKTEGYAEYHLKAEWLKKCFEYTSLVYGVATLETIYRLFSKNIDFDADYDEFTKLLNSFPDSVNPCVIQGNYAISKYCLAGDMYKQIMNDHTLKKYYIPSYNEIVIMAENSWPAYLIVYNRIRDYIRAEFSPDEEELPDIMILINQMLSLAASEVAVVSAIEDAFDICITGKKLSGFLALLRDALPQTRNMFYKGFTLNDLLNIKTDGKIISDGLEYTSEEKANRELYELLNSAFGKSGSSGTVRKNPEDRIKPNSPCPCGSGKKYKKCCGMGV